MMIATVACILHEFSREIYVHGKRITRLNTHIIDSRWIRSWLARFSFARCADSSYQLT